MLQCHKYKFKSCKNQFDKKLHAVDRYIKKVDFVTLRTFFTQAAPTDYHRFVYKCHDCLLGFKRRGMLVNHLAKRHPEVSPTNIPELNLPILKTTKDFYCQYCSKVSV